MIGKQYYRIMLGRRSSLAEKCREGGYIGGDWGMDFDLSEELTDDWREFNKKFIPVFLSKNPEKSKISAGLACGMLHTICKGINRGDIVLCPNGKGAYYIGEVVSDYIYQSGEPLPHRRKVKWIQGTLNRSDMSQALQNSSGSIATVSHLKNYTEELDNLLSGNTTEESLDESIEDPTEFAMEKHLEDFLIQNWENTELGKNYDIYEEDGELIGKQFKCDTGYIDILAISKDKKEWLVVELKRGRASDVVVGQIQRYMGYLMDDIAEEDQVVKGAIIALKDSLKVRRALKAARNIEFYRYQISFNLFNATTE